MKDPSSTAKWAILKFWWKFSNHKWTKAYYTITPMSITIDNTQKSSDNSECQSNGVQNQPQQDSPPPQGTIPEVGGAGSGSQSVTYLENSSGLPSAMSVVQSASTTGPQTSQTSVPVTTLTIEVISATTLTDTLAGSTVVTTSWVHLVLELQELIVHSHRFSTTTVTAVMATSDVAHFFPVNKAMPSARTSLASGAIAAVLMTLLLFWTVIFHSILPDMDNIILNIWKLNTGQVKGESVWRLSCDPDYQFRFFLFWTNIFQDETDQ